MLHAMLLIEPHVQSGIGPLWTAKQNLATTTGFLSVCNDAQGDFYTHTGTVVQKVSSNGVAVWQSKIPTGYASYCIAPHSVEGALLLGYYSTGTPNGLLTHYSHSGAILSRTLYTHSTAAVGLIPMRVVGLPNGGAVMLVRSNTNASYPAITGGPVAVRVDSSGNILWQKLLTKPGTTSAVSTSTGLAVDASGNSYITGSLATKGVLSKFDANGSLIWTLTFAGFVPSNVEVSGSSLILGGTLSSNAVLLSISDSGAVQWAKQIGSDTRIVGLNANADGSIYASVVSGVSTLTSVSTTLYPHVVKYSSTGNQLWVRRFVGSVYASPSAWSCGDLISTDDGRVVLPANANLSGSGSGLLIVYSSDGSLLNKTSNGFKPTSATLTDVVTTITSVTETYSSIDGYCVAQASSLAEQASAATVSVAAYA